MLDSPLLCVVKELVSGFINRGNRLNLYYNEFILSGGDNRDRTGNLQLAKLALSQLSYVPVSVPSFQLSVPSWYFLTGN